MFKRVFDETIKLADNALLRHHPEMFYEWDFEKNDEQGIDVYEISFRNDKKVWWIGECGHGWSARVANRTKENGSGCPYCAKSNPKVLRGFNDMWTNNPKLASMLADPENGYKYGAMSRKKVDWKCLECGNTLKNKAIRDICYQGLSCPICSDGIKFPEKFMCNLLKESEISFKFNSTQEWSQGKRYDFYLPKYNWVIEVHGGQHYGKGFSKFKGARTLKEEQENDILKEQLAIKNGIDNYIVIDASESTVEWVKKSVVKSDIMDIIGVVDFEKIGRLSSVTLIRTISDLWKHEKIRDTQKIANILNITTATARKYLRRGAEIGWCDYTVDFGHKNRAKWRRRPVVQLSLNQEFIREWESVIAAAKSLEMSPIHDTCKGKQKKSGGFKWMYKEDYQG